tara:strand:- start:3130 stop:3561 length:432 start_codon:yes stop_codon:yes gene_type:complete
MKRSHHEILKHIFDNDSNNDNDNVGIKELFSMMVRKHNDHRDFYALAALIDAGYVGFTGPIFNKEDGAMDTYKQVRLFQAYSQGDGNQTYEGTTILAKTEDSYLYVAAKAIEYFHARNELRMGWILTAVLAFIAAVISGIIVN